MIIGIGTDIVEVERIRKSLLRFGERFARKILVESEFARFRESALPVHFLARRFAAKEAAAKALGTGMRNGVAFRQFLISKLESGAPQLTLQGRASELARDKGINNLHISISDENKYAQAFVVMER